MMVSVFLWGNVVVGTMKLSFLLDIRKFGRLVKHQSFGKLF